jgi:hypothetical protein
MLFSDGLFFNSNQSITHYIETRQDFNHYKIKAGFKISKD